MTRLHFLRGTSALHLGVVALSLLACESTTIVGGNTTHSGGGGGGGGAGGDVSTASGEGASTYTSSGSGNSGGGVLPKVDKVDLLFAIDNSASMADKQEILAVALADMTEALTNPPCLDGDGLPVHVAGPSTPCPAGS